MSLIGLALRVAAVRAIEAAAILPAGRVFDSHFLPLDDIAEGALEPFLIVSTEKISGNPSGRDINNGERDLELVMEIGVTKAITVSVPDGEDRIELAMVETDAGLEASLALLERQVMACLFGRGGGAWGDAFRGLCSQIREVVSLRGVSAKDGVRFCARQVTLTVQPIAEPPFGATINPKSPLAAFFAVAAEDGQVAGIARAMREAVEGIPQDWPAIYTAAAVLGGYTEEEADQLGFALIEPDDSPEPVAEIIIEGPGGASFAVNAGAVADQLPEAGEGDATDP
jgi:hypothetical protein